MNRASRQEARAWQHRTVRVMLVRHAPDGMFRNWIAHAWINNRERISEWGWTPENALRRIRCAALARREYAEAWSRSGEPNDSEEHYLIAALRRHGVLDPDEEDAGKE